MNLDPNPPEPRADPSGGGVWLGAVLALATASALAVFARGLAGDEEVAHYLIARYAPVQPELFLSAVGRPLVTLALCAPAQVGLLAARLMSAVAAAAAAWAVARMVARAGWLSSSARCAAPVGAAAFLLVQPFFLAHAGTAMTEPWAALLVALLILAYAERRYAALALAASLLPVARLELGIFLPLAALVLIDARRWRELLLLPVGLLLWNGLGALASGDPLWLVNHLEPRLYPAREPLLYARSYVWIVGLGLFVPATIGLVRALAARLPEGGEARGASGGEPREERLGEPRGETRRSLEASAVVVVILFVLYTYLATWRPLTYGNLRYLAFGAPALAVLAAAGVEGMTGPRRAWTWIGLAAAAAGALFLWGRPVHEGSDVLDRRSLLPAVVAAGWILFTLLPRRPVLAASAAVVVLGAWSLVADHPGTLHLRPNAEQVGVARSAALVDREALGERPVFTAHPLLAWHLGINPYDRDRCPPVDTRSLDAAPPGALWFWESHYTPRPGSAFDPSTVAADPRWRYLGGAVAPDSAWTGAFFLRLPAEGPAPVTGGIDRSTWFAAARLAEAGVGYAARAAREDADNPARWQMLADRLAVAGRLEEAREALARADELAPGDPVNDAVRAFVLLQEGRPEEALAAAQRAHERAPENPILEYLVGQALWALDRPEEARPYVLGAVPRLGERWDAWILAGDVHHGAGEWEPARRYYRSALDLKPGDLHAGLRAAECDWRLGNREAARGQLETLAAAHPRAGGPYLLLGDLLAEEGLPAEARRTWEEGLALTGDEVLARRLESAAP